VYAEDLHAAVAIALANRQFPGLGGPLPSGGRGGRGTSDPLPPLPPRYNDDWDEIQPLNSTASSSIMREEPVPPSSSSAAAGGPGAPGPEVPGPEVPGRDLLSGESFEESLHRIAAMNLQRELASYTNQRSANYDEVPLN
jgi:hypothetical protein